MSSNGNATVRAGRGTRRPCGSLALAVPQAHAEAHQEALAPAGRRPAHLDQPRQPGCVRVRLPGRPARRRDRRDEPVGDGEDSASPSSSPTAAATKADRARSRTANKAGDKAGDKPGPNPTRAGRPQGRPEATGPGRASERPLRASAASDAPATTTPPCPPPRPRPPAVTGCPRVAPSAIGLLFAAAAATAVVRRRRGPRHVSARLPRDLHPVAWWLWAIGLATAASLTTNPLHLLLLVGVATVVVMGGGPTSRGRGRSASTCGSGDHRRDPSRSGWCSAVATPARSCWTSAGPAARVGRRDHAARPGHPRGPAGGVVRRAPAGHHRDLHRRRELARQPKRLLRSVPLALYEIGTALVVAVTVLPQFADSVRRVRAAQSLRAGETGRVGRLRRFLGAGAEDALERSLALAAGMDARGYGRATGLTPARRQGHRRPDAGRPRRHLRRHVRRPRPDGPALPGAPDARRGRARRRRGAAQRRPPRRAHPLPPGPVALARARRGRLRGVHRHHRVVGGPEPGAARLPRPRRLPRAERGGAARCRGRPWRRALLAAAVGAVRRCPSPPAGGGA